MTRRIERVNALLAEEISDLIRRQIQDPRLATMVSVIAVDTSPDLRNATVSVSVLGSEEEARLALTALRHAAGYLRHEMAERLRMKHIPELSFKRDTSIAQGARVLELLKEIQDERDGDPK
ncbi:MAG TPA: 30S ribosome-binding factor RbfA [Chloroflexota bacterium]